MRISAGVQTCALPIFKLALFGGMLGLGALHRWTLVPRLGRELTSGDPAQEARAWRQSVTAEAALAILILIVVSALGTLSPETLFNQHWLTAFARKSVVSGQGVTVRFDIGVRSAIKK